MGLMEDEIQKALLVLQAGGTILYPTDTIWGIGCDATRPEAVKKVYRIKQREDSKSMLVLLDTPNRLTSYVSEIPDVAWELMDVADKPLTIIYSGAKNLAENLVAADNSIGIRIAADSFCQKLIGRLRKPLVSTSANISGNPTPKFFDEIDEKIKNAVDYIVDWQQEDRTPASPSGIIKLGPGGEVEIIRK